MYVSCFPEELRLTKQSADYIEEMEQEFLYNVPMVCGRSDFSSEQILIRSRLRRTSMIYVEICPFPFSLARRRRSGLKQSQTRSKLTYF